MNLTKNIFINSGIRQTINHPLLQDKAVTALGYAIATLLAQEFGHSCNIVIGTDTRPSGQRIKDTFINALLDYGHDVFDAGTVPTPFIAKALKDFVPEEDDEPQEPFFTLGIVITASHNPANFNGIKILTPFGYADETIEQEITELFFKLYHNPEIIADLDHEPGYLESIDLVTWYQCMILEHIKKNTSHTKILLDCANGSASSIAPKIFQSFGYQTEAINNQTDGSNINHNSGCQNPKLLLNALQKSDALWACAFDGDADRVIIAHRNGTVFDGDDILAILAEHERYKNNVVFVGTIMSNQGLEQHYNIQNKKFLRTAVGERNLIDALVKHQAFLGAETCGHIIMMDHAFCSDGIFVALQFLELIHKQNITHPFAKHHQEHAVIDIIDKAIFMQYANQIATLQKQYESEQSCRIVIRASNTEPILRIMVESIDSKAAISICLKLQNQLTELLNH